MRRWIVIGLVAALVAVLAGSQLALPPIAEHRIADRLTVNGGSAEVSVSAFPAGRLLFGDGDRLDVAASGLHLELPSEAGTLSRLDGFDHVDVHMDDSAAGPFRFTTLDLARDGSEPYRFTLRGGSTTRALIAYGADQLGFIGGTALRFLGNEAVGENRPLPMRFDMQLSDEDGRLQVVSGTGTIAGIPTGPLAELITSAIVIRL
jgi:hypothetical protein